MGNRGSECVVVLGGLGFMGSHLCHSLVRSGYQVTVFDRPGASRESIKDIQDELAIVAGDVSRPDEVLAIIRNADAVIDLVHTTVPGSSMKDPAYDVSSNVVPAVKWLSRLPETNVRQLLYVSSGGTVYGLPLTNPITESHPTDPISSYGVTKLAIEKYVALYSKLAGIKYCILRPSNVYGVGQQLQSGQGIIGIMVQRALSGDPLEVWGTGENQRDYLYIDDLVSAVTAMLSYSGAHNVFNVSSGTGHSVLDIVEVIRARINPDAEIRFMRAREFDVPNNVLDSNLLRSELGWEPNVNLEAGIARTIDWLTRGAAKTMRVVEP